MSQANALAAPLDALAWAYGGPVLRAGFKQVPEDFWVEELLGFSPDGVGEHLFVEIEKSGLTTFEAQALLARHFRLPLRDTQFAGMKDKQGVTRQWFSLHLGKRAEPAESFSHPQLRLLQQLRNSRKLRRGSHKGNRFRIVLRAPVGDRDVMLERLHTISTSGVPNYFGAQRFGRDGANVVRAQAWFSGGSTPLRTERSLLLSAARSCLFNACLSARVAAGTWNRCIDGDVLALAGTASTFASARAGPEELQRRLASFDIHPTGPLWGRGEPPVSGAALALEQQVVATMPALAAGLVAQGLEQERRPLRLQVSGLQGSFETNVAGKSTMENQVLVLEFSLVRGSYATAVLRELLEPVAGNGG